MRKTSNVLLRSAEELDTIHAMEPTFPKYKDSDKSKYADYNPIKHPKENTERPIVAPGGKDLGTALPMTPPKKSS